jgi:zinc transporter ZupT
LLPFADSFLTWTLATALPVLAGLVLITLVGGALSPRFSAAFGIGIFFWFFVDTIQGSSNLLVNEGFAWGTNQIVVVLLFMIGVLAFFSADGRLFSRDPSTRRFIVPLLAALALGIHGFGEGSAFGSTASQTSSTSILDAFGGTSAGVAYSLHKMLEPMMVGALYSAYARGFQRSIGKSAVDLLTLTLAFAFPSLLGAISGYFVRFDVTFMFALGTGTSIYAMARLANQVFFESIPAGRGESMKVAVAILAGFILIYLAALLHS